MTIYTPAALGLYCSFCGKGQHEVAVLIAGPQVNICDDCVKASVFVLAHRRERMIDGAVRAVACQELGRDYVRVLRMCPISFLARKWLPRVRREFYRMQTT